MSIHVKKNHTLRNVLISIAVVICLIAVFAVVVYRTYSPTDLFNSTFVQHEIQKRAGDENQALATLIPTFLGFDTKKTYLLLFLNNTEIRPGGGFIGSYAVVTVEKGNISMVTLEGSEQLDRRTPANWKPTPPAPITDHLGVDRWYFRDSNWDPDFSSNAERAMEFFEAEGGVLADDIDYVLAMTTEVIESVLQLVGPVVVQGKTFNADNVIEVLQYDTSYDYESRGIDFADRKQILDPLFDSIVRKIPASLFKQSDEYIALVNRLMEEKHIQMYSPNPDIQKVLLEREIAGFMKSPVHDQLLWIDANLAALKTDRVIDRDLSYRITTREDGRHEASVTMHYTHSGIFDWRTSRYRTYARIFVPRGSTLISTEGSLRTDRTTDVGTTQSGDAFGTTWFGTFTSIEPGTTRDLTFTYLLPNHISEQIDAGTYDLLVQKQAGTLSPELSLFLDFGSSIKDAKPVEPRDKWGDSVYDIHTLLRTDSEFTVSL